MVALSIALLGNFKATLHNRLLPSFRTSKVQALLIYLVTEQSMEKPGAHPCEKLLDLLWLGLPERSARQNLRQVIYHLRKMIPDLAQPPAFMESYLTGTEEEIGRAIKGYEEMGVSHLMFHCSPYNEQALTRLATGVAVYRNMK